MDKMKSVNGELTSSDCYQKASIAEINGIKIPFLHINHLLDNKKAVDRAKDRLDVFYLEKIKELREESWFYTIIGSNLNYNWKIGVIKYKSS